MKPSRFLPALLLLACAAACLAVSSQSYWIDEAQTATKAIQPTLHSWWAALDGEHNSNMQLPLYMVYIWGWARLFGASEMALRAANIPWFFAGFFAIRHFLRRRSALRDATLLLYCLHPFVWCYLNEARPYLMQLAGALLVSGALFVALEEPEEALPSSWWWLLGAGIMLLCGAGILGIPWIIGITLLLLQVPGFRRSIFRSGMPALCLFAPLLGVLAVYFAWTIKEKVSPGQYAMNGASMLSVFYEQLGFLGLGPGRDDLRMHALSGITSYLLPLALLGIPLAWALMLAARERFGLPPRRMVSILLLVVSPVVLVFALGFLKHARILARHLMPLFPFILVAQAYAILLLWKSNRPLARAGAVLIVLALAASSLEVRFAFRHSRDDYRDAAASANKAVAAGKKVWWVAADQAAVIYHLPLSSRDEPGTAWLLYGLPSTVTTPPDEIFLSKPDLTDRDGTVSAYIAAHHYRPAATWQAFTLYEKP